MQCSAHHINPNRSADYSLDRNGVDDGTGAIAAIGATGIRPREVVAVVVPTVVIRSVLWVSGAKFEC